MNSEAQDIFNKILNKLESSETLSDYDASFLRARRSYLSSWQKFKYGDILYLNKQFLFQKLKKIGIFLGKSIYKIIIAIIVTIIVSLILAYLKI